ncbi:MAG: DUF4342 domain-containing protein [Clostridiales bacterium]|nr:DUF4342 domain-containing protein [Clostridia bacterium]MCR5567426.1 DUF4342 domain-containing protein [Clostridiales bacterium]
MEPYTIEDIELLRKKSGLSYQEAVALLDYHSGSLARALIDLEKHGKLKNEENNMKEGTRNMNGNTKKSETKEKALNFLQKLYRSRVKIRKGDTNIFNVSVLFAGLCLILAPHMTIAGIIVSMILGYQFSFTGMDPDFASDSLEKMVKSAAQNAKSSVSSVVQTITSETKELQKKNSAKPEAKPVKERAEDPVKTASATEDAEFAAQAQSLRDQAKELEETMDSFFESNPAATSFHSAYSAAASSVPTIQVPVQTETRDGEVTKEDDQDGYSSVTIG